ncbi:BTAD domain-containing putative transcriptional regulator [Nonomuraea sp. B10E15]|uniref:BTAD domain-containing putative transcriptional regulator n=1 Tax=Nonomuraea sp. B10E15 TaxID=3153560 RepID=UPI00325DDFCF
MAAEPRFGVLGPVAVWRDGERIEVRPPKRAGVLGALLIRAGQVVPSCELAAAVWEGEPPPSAAKNLQTYVHGLRRLLGDPGRIVRVGEGYRLVVRFGELDADRFAAFTRAAQVARNPGDAAGLTRRALALWRGDEAFGGAPGTVPIRAEAERLEAERLALLATWADAELASGRAVDTVPELTRFTTAYPLCEDLWARLIRALHGCGRRADALRAFDRARVTLLAELGAEPGSELRRLREEVISVRQVPRHRDPGDTAHERVESLVATVSAMLVPLRVTAAEEGFWAHTTGRRAGDVLVARITGAAHQVRREPSAITSGDQELLKVVLNRAARPLVVAQDGRCCSVPPGHLVACDTTRPYKIDAPGDCDVSVVAVPRGVLPAEAPADRTALPLPAGRGIAAMATACVTRASEHLDGLPDEARRHLGDGLASLLMATLTGTIPERVETRSSLANRIIAYTLANLDDPALCAAVVARRHGISVRHLHRLFAGRDRPFAAWVRQERLQRIRRDLQDPTQAGIPAAEIASRWGLRDPAHLGRVLKAEFGLTAAEIRSSAR